MNRPACRIGLGWSVALLLCGAPARADTDAQERARIAREQAQADQAYAQRQAECAQRFVVTACAEDARARHRDASTSLRRQSALLDEAERKRRAAQRSEAIREKVSAQEQVERESPRELAAPALKPAQRPASHPPPRDPAPVDKAQRSAQEARSRALFDARQRQAQRHREEVQRRAEEHTRPDRPATAAPPASAAR